MADRPPVVVNLKVEYSGGHEQEVIEIPRDEWDAMTPAQRLADVEERAANHAYNYVGWGWHIDNTGDYDSVANVREN
jgi:hypothetical protein